jgi:hypothetical protein
MTDQDDWDFAGVASGLPPEQPNPLDDGLPGG